MTTLTPCFFKAETLNFDLQAFKERLVPKLVDLCELIELKLGPEINSERCLILTINDRALNEEYEIEIVYQPELEEDAFIALIRERITDLNENESTEEPFSNIEIESTYSPLGQ